MQNYYVRDPTVCGYEIIKEIKFFGVITILLIEAKEIK